MNEKYDELNETELVELCKQRCILVAHRGLGREALIDLLEGRLPEDICDSDPIDEDRDFMQFMQRKYPDTIFGQLQCKDENYYCPDCPTGRVVICTVVDCSPSMRRQMAHEMLLEKQRRIK